MKRYRQQKPQIEDLEAKMLLNGSMPTAPSHAASLVSPMATRQHLLLNGTITGTLMPQFMIPDIGTTFNLNGTGRIGPLGMVNAHGSFHATGFIFHGHATGDLTLSNGAGSVKLHLEGPTQPGFSPLPNSFQFTIESGTGRFGGATGSGTVTLQRGAGSQVTLVFHATR
jgi:hypothetical protein